MAWGGGERAREPDTQTGDRGGRGWRGAAARETESQTHRQVTGEVAGGVGRRRERQRARHTHR